MAARPYIKLIKSDAFYSGKHATLVMTPERALELAEGLIHGARAVLNNPAWCQMVEHEARTETNDGYIQFVITHNGENER